MKTVKLVTSQQSLWGHSPLNSAGNIGLRTEGSSQFMLKNLIRHVETETGLPQAKARAKSAQRLAQPLATLRA